MPKRDDLIGWTAKKLAPRVDGPRYEVALSNLTELEAGEVLVLLNRLQYERDK